MTRIWEMWSFAIRYETQDAKNSFCSSGSHASIIYCILRAVISAQTPLLKAKGSVLTEWWWYDKELWMKQVHLFVPKSPLVREHISHIMLQCVTPWWFSVFVHWTKQHNSDVYLNPCVILPFYSHRLIHMTAVVTIWFREEVKCIVWSMRTTCSRSQTTCTVRLFWIVLFIYKATFIHLHANISRNKNFPQLHIQIL